MSELGQTPVLEVDLGALVTNWRLACAAFSGRLVTAVVKSDAYGLGLDPVVEALAGAGCAGFWAISLDEAARIRAIAPAAEIYALHGLAGEPARAFLSIGAQPVVASLDDLRQLAGLGLRPRCAVQLDTGLTRLGLVEDDLDIARAEGLFERVEVSLWVSHLVRFDDLDQPLNALQRLRLAEWTRGLPPAPLSLAASSASFGAPLWHFDVARVGSALYGVPTARGQRPTLAAVASLRGPVLRVADVGPGVNIGYRELFATRRPSRVATVALGYATGVPQSAGGRAVVALGCHLAPVIGGISMNLLSVDVTDLPADAVRPGVEVEFFGPVRRIDEVAASLGMSPNALLTGAGGRLPRRYRPAQTAQPEPPASGRKSTSVGWSSNSHPSFKKADQHSRPELGPQAHGSER